MTPPDHSWVSYPASNSHSYFTGLHRVYVFPKWLVEAPFPPSPNSPGRSFDLKMGGRYLLKQDYLPVEAKFNLQVDFADDSEVDVDFSIGEVGKLSIYGFRYLSEGRFRERKEPIEKNASAGLLLEDEKLIFETRSPGIFSFEIKIGSSHSDHRIQAMDRDSFSSDRELYALIDSHLKGKSNWDDLSNARFRESLGRFSNDSDIPESYLNGIYEFVLFHYHKMEKSYLERIAAAKTLLLPFFDLCEYAKSIVLYSSYAHNNWSFLDSACSSLGDRSSSFYKAKNFFLGTYDDWIKSVKKRKSFDSKVESVGRFNLPVMKRDDVSLRLVERTSRDQADLSENLELLKSLPDGVRDSMSYRKAEVRENLLAARLLRRSNNVVDARKAYRKLLDVVDEDNPFHTEAKSFL